MEALHSSKSFHAFLENNGLDASIYEKCENIPRYIRYAYFTEVWSYYPSAYRMYFLTEKTSVYERVNQRRINPRMPDTTIGDIETQLGTTLDKVTF
jgi:hypothetical protein